LKSDLVVFVPAFFQSSVFPDVLIRKLNQRTLTERAIDKAIKLTGYDSSVHVLTDSEEIALIARRAGVCVFYDPIGNWTDQGVTPEMLHYVQTNEEGNDQTLILSVYAPLLTLDTLRTALSRIREDGVDMLQPVRQEEHSYTTHLPQTVNNILFNSTHSIQQVESGAFYALRSGVLAANQSKEISVSHLIVGQDAIEIDSLWTWWICEKFLQRKRIAFRVIGNNDVGMGHIYRALSIAHEMTDHEVLFFTDPGSDIAIRELAESEYQVETFQPEMLTTKMIECDPQLVVLDMLDTDSEEVLRFSSQGIAVASFEDLGSGAEFTDLTINELYDQAVRSGENYRWGHKYFFVREEFNSATPRAFSLEIQAVLLAFGGTDQHDLSRRIFETISEVCFSQHIHIHIVTGPGYKHRSGLAKVANVSGVTLTHATGVISGIMEQCDLAITSNGRTVYELAHMNIPTIVVDQHERENTHHFAREENGFLPCGVYEKGKTESVVLQNLSNLLSDSSRRRSLYLKTRKYSFSEGKRLVAKSLIALMENDIGSR
jgi:spore coat polysaccharide biosynthesis predicted glycosyltransferase SpsG/CMP-N-acetylneuraminic acid synthetase